MDNPKNIGNGEPNTIKSPEQVNNPTDERINKNPISVEDLTADDLAVIFELFDYLRKARDLTNTQVDGLEPENATQDNGNDLNKKVG